MAEIEYVLSPSQLDDLRESLRSKDSEIERLRAENELFSAENARLQNDLERHKTAIRWQKVTIDNRDKEIAGLRAALEPFAKAVDYLDSDASGDDPLAWFADRAELTVADVQKARAALWSVEGKAAPQEGWADRTIRQAQENEETRHRLQREFEAQEADEGAGPE